GLAAALLLYEPRGDDLLPEGIDLLEELIPGAGVIHHGVRGGEALLPADLGRDAAAGVLLIEAAGVDQAVDADLVRRVNDEHVVHLLVLAVLNEQRHVIDQYRHAIGAGLGEAVEGAFPDAGVGDGVEFFGGIRGGEGLSGELGAVEGAVRVEHPAEGLSEFCERWFAGLDNLAGDLIGVDDPGAQGLQSGGDGRFPGSDAAGESDEKHCLDPKSSTAHDWLPAGTVPTRRSRWCSPPAAYLPCENHRRSLLAATD